MYTLLFLTIIFNLQMSFKKLVNDAEIEFEEIIDLQEQLYSLDSTNFDSVHKSILESKFLSNRESLSILLRCIDGSFDARPLSFSFYLEIIKSISDQIRSTFTSYELFTDLIKNNYLKFKLYELGFIDLSTVLFHLKKKSNDLNLFFIFAFEVKKNDIGLYSSYTAQSSSFREFLATVTPEEHEILRSKGLNQAREALLIRSNDASGFQSYQNLNNLSIDLKIKSNYENRQFSEETLSLIEYAALFGAVDVFKFLLLKNASLSTNLPKYAVTGGNYEIIHILEQNGIKFNNEESLNAAIKYHRNELVQYIRESLEVEYSIESLKTSLTFYNLSIFFDILKGYNEVPVFQKPKMNLISYAVQCGYIDVVKTFSKLIENSEEINRLVSVAVNHRHFDVFKFLHTKLLGDGNVKPNNSELLLTAASIGHITIFKYLLNLVDQNCFEILNAEKNSALNLAASYGELENVKFIVSLGPTAAQLNNRNVYGVFF